MAHYVGTSALVVLEAESRGTAGLADSEATHTGGLGSRAGGLRRAEHQMRIADRPRPMATVTEAFDFLADRVSL